MIEGEPFEYPITDTIDLHQFTPRDMKPAFEAWLEEVHQRGFAEVRVIHGRGIGFQREMVRKILANSPFVLEFHDAPMEAGGWGATVIRLR